MSDPAIPIIDTRTCREKQDAIIDNLWGAVDTITRRCATLAAELETLRARVAKLEAQHAPEIYVTPELLADFVLGSGAFLTEIEVVIANPPYAASTATPGQTYTWLPGDAWSQYCEEQP